MAKLSGSTNYKLSEVRRLLAPVEHYLPLGKYEWERLANSYNANRGRGVAERDHESLRRKFKVLSSARKPTGVAGMASHVQLSKQLKQAIDEKASVVDMDDAADVDQDEEEEYQQDFSFDFEGDEGLEDNTRVLDDADTGVSTTYNDSMHSGEVQAVVGDAGSVCNGELSGLLDAAGVCEGLEAFAQSCPCAVETVDAAQVALSAKKVGQVPSAAAAAAAASTTAASSRKDKSAPQQGAKGHTPIKKESKPKGYVTSSTRLGGIDLADFRNTVGGANGFRGRQGARRS
ncbi:hypothetical protein PF005_g25671 [Phytophthora fragariae]|uniref:DUF6818 domain-containing protein n=1 Tax=Phytophthora fragariae TaxID=53985 RepID=A0A6A3I0L0_9STRA|nr:hypothetical protein PF003_g29837 [Phytophthora fragariae]KAE8923681.1 hypothetical protein PF009_g26074 [Phytophthora fragariae]KAE8975521.1 hypothetical protein PF011_g24430 [Phytophthora fragariae]KAE9074602.1 hypothetical protein PF010_g24615 [Phytophthora fragariae]KAE9087315.1 hypothetical protein PF006_g25831 [Phytophthora fragariae]